MSTLANSEDRDEMPHDAAFHQGLHCLLRQEHSSEKKLQFHLEIIICNPLIFTTGICLGLIWGLIMTPSQNEQKLPKMVYITSNFLVLHFGENFMKIRSKIPKLQMYEKLHKNVSE